MCSEVLVVEGDKTTQCETIMELANALGVSPSTVSDDPPSFCLCNAHWDALGAREMTDDERMANPFADHIILVPDLS